MSVKISLGKKKKSFPSIKAASEATGIPYMTLYMRLRFGKPVKAAIREPVRPYNRAVAA